MTIQTKMKMTERNLLKHIKKTTNPKHYREEVHYAYKLGNSIRATDSHRAIYIKHSDLQDNIIKQDNDFFAKIEKATHDNVDDTEWNERALFTFSKETLKPILQMLKTLKALGYTTMEFLNNQENLIMQGSKDSTYLADDTKQLMTVSYEVGKPINKVYLDEMATAYRFNLNYMIDIFTFLVDSKEELVRMYLNQSNMRPCHFTSATNEEPNEMEDWVYTILPMRVY